MKYTVSCTAVMIFFSTLSNDYHVKDVITKDVTHNFPDLHGSPHCAKLSTTFTTVDNRTPFLIEIVKIDGYFQPGQRKESISTPGYYGDGSAHIGPAVLQENGLIEAGKKYKILAVPRNCSNFSESDPIPFIVTIKIPPIGEILLEEQFLYFNEQKDRLIKIAVRSGESYQGTNTAKIELTKNFHVPHKIKFTKDNEDIIVTIQSNTNNNDDIECIINYTKKEPQK